MNNLTIGPVSYTHLGGTFFLLNFTMKHERRRRQNIGYCGSRSDGKRWIYEGEAA